MKLTCNNCTLNTDGAFFMEELIIHDLNARGEIVGTATGDKGAPQCSHCGAYADEQEDEG